MHMPQNLDELWPPFGLTIALGPVTLSPVRDDDLPALAALVHDGVHSPADMPFSFPWTTGSPGEVRLRLLQYHWAKRAALSPAAWTLETTVRFNGEIVGCQSISTTDYLVTRTGETGSWLGMKHHGRGIGTLMRQALCAFMFDHLGAAEVTSAAFLDNAPSLAVSRKVGYTENGVARLKRRDGEMAVIQRLVVTAETLNRPEFELRGRGVGPMQELLGLIHNRDPAESGVD
ncbi:N-acetyltransferase [Cryobacterium algoricola]|uniref:N-acetyltransferase n=2 Tax=Cryobacterium algoricola TaxID=1259183 RepID=A0ABY2I9Z5_9MICO|nr:N-acetyltransferase [Cryobacterium algoricola]